MASEIELRQSAIDCLYGMLKGRRKLSKVKGELAIEILAEMREAKAAKVPPDWVLQEIAETAREIEAERRNKWRD